MATELPLVRTPEIVIFNIIKLGLDFISLDWKSKTDKTTSWLYKVVENISIQKIGFFAEAESIFIKQGGKARSLDVNLMYNMKDVKPPSIYISLGNENTSSQNAMGMDEGYQEQLFDDLTYKSVFTRRFSANYNIVITSDNSNEVIIIYHVLKALLIGMYFHLHKNGIENLKLGGADLNINQSLMPKHLFSRAISLNFDYETSAPEPVVIKFPTDFEIEGKPTL